MTQILRVRARWTGFTGAPGFTVMHFRDFVAGGGGAGGIDAAMARGASDRVQTFFAAIAALLPSTVQINIDPEVDVIEDTTEELVRSYTNPAPAQIVGRSVGAYSTAVGAVINWRTDGVRKGRRVRGRTFLVPLGGAQFGANGQLLPASVNIITNAATALADSAGTPDLFVFGRPTPADPDTGTEKLDDGVSHVVTNVSVPPMGAVLRSRRD